MPEIALLNQASAPTGVATTADGPLTLPPELLAEASRRLGWAGLLYASAYLAAYFGPYAAAVLSGKPYLGTVQTTVAVMSIVLGLAVFVLSRRAAMAPQTFLDFGLVFGVVGALGISVAEFWQGFLHADLVFSAYLGIPWECAWIIIFPLVAPNTPGKILIASLAAASTGPLVVFISPSFTGIPLSAEPYVFVTYFLFTTYLCVGLAYFISHIVYRYGVRLKKATEIGSYELVNRLGAGGMGEVWVGRHRMLARPAAVKLIRPELLGADPGSHSTAIRRFEREARATATLRSTHTVDVYDFGMTDEGAFFYVMELLDGISLEVLVKQFGPVSPVRAVHFLTQVCHSLGEAHETGLIHRDIKPANIFTCRLGPDYDFVKVLDFGLVKHRVESDNATATELTGVGVTAGTPAYMAPEMALAKPGVDGRADLYAVGCVGYWLVTGQQVFTGDTPVATILHHVRTMPEPLSSRTEIAIPDALERLIMSCLAKDPADRPASAQELAQRLVESVDGARWTAEDARAWWDLHKPRTVTSASGDACAVVRPKR